MLSMLLHAVAKFDLAMCVAFFCSKDLMIINEADPEVSPRIALVNHKVSESSSRKNRACKSDATKNLSFRPKRSAVEESAVAAVKSRSFGYAQDDNTRLESWIQKDHFPMQIAAP
jgi:hypothetical protein